MARIKQEYDEEKGLRIKKARIDKGLSRQQLSSELITFAAKHKEYKDIPNSLSAIKSWEGIGRKYSPDNTTLKALSIVLGVEYDWLLHGSPEDIIRHSMKILSTFVPTEDNVITFHFDYFSINGEPLPNEIAKEISLLYPLFKSGHKIEAIFDIEQYREYMESSIKNSIEFYIKYLNRKDERNETDVHQEN